MNIAEVKRLAAYNEWANARVLRTVAELGGNQATKNLEGSFPSIRDTVSHIVATEWLWLRRWKGESPDSLPEWSVAADPELLRNKLDEIETERASFLSSLRDPDLKREISYRNLKGEPWRYSLADLLLHLINHSTYHRGQVATMLRQVGATPLPTDLLVFRDEAG